MAASDRRFSSPILKLHIGKEDWAAAIDSASGGCLIAEAIKRQYPHLSRITVDMATIRATDSEKGMRYTWLQPGMGQHMLLAFDQGWRQPTEDLATKRAVIVSPVVARDKNEATHREARLAELEAKIESGEDLTRGEKIAVSRLRKPPRPTARGKAEIKVDSRGYAVVSGAPPMQGKPHPNLLRGRDRHFGAKIAEPTLAFQEAVDQAVAQHLAETENSAA